MPHVSVIIPTYNREKFIGTTIESVINQTYKDIEIIVVDDASTDKTVEIVSEMQKQSNLPFRIEILPENYGVSSARNLGIFRAQGNLISFLDSDDFWFPQKLEKQIEFLKKWPDHIGVGSNVEYVNINEENKVRYKKELQLNETNFLYELINNCFIATSCLLIKKEPLILAGLFDSRLRKSQDRDLWWRLPRFGKLGYIDEPLVRYIVHGESISKTQSKNTAQTYLPALQRTLWYWRDNLTKKQVNAILANAYMMIAYDSVAAGESFKSIRNALKSIRYGNSSSSVIKFMMSNFYKSVS
ncbi:MAG: glycosyltransferase family 2 protein [Desulfuromonadales bacterium]